MGNSHFVWVAERDRWMQCTAWEAMAAWVKLGREVAWGRRYPLRRGVDRQNVTEMERLQVWAIYLDGITADPASRPRCSSLPTLN